MGLERRCGHPLCGTCGSDAAVEICFILATADPGQLDSGHALILPRPRVLHVSHQPRLLDEPRVQEWRGTLRHELPFTEELYSGNHSLCLGLSPQLL